MASDKARGKYTAGFEFEDVRQVKTGQAISVVSKVLNIPKANPLLKPEPNGSYRKLSVTEAANTVVCVVLEEPGKPDTQMTAKKFIQANPHLEGRVRAQLQAAGL